MSDFERYAIFYLPDDPALAAFGASWLGWDIQTGSPAPHLDIARLAEITETPRKYGFHGTLKPPFRLAEGKTRDALEHDLATLAARTKHPELAGLEVAQIGRFLALVPTGDTRDLATLAFTCVRTFDAYRRPPSGAELARRRQAELTPRQETLLHQWGYPYVDAEFRFHLTLSGQLDALDLETALTAARAHLPALPQPFSLASVTLAGERPDGMFQAIRRYALNG